jgi:hypothetical protein
MIASAPVRSDDAFSHGKSGAELGAQRFFRKFEFNKPVERSSGDAV